MKFTVSTDVVKLTMDMIEFVRLCYVYIVVQILPGMVTCYSGRLKIETCMYI